MSCKLSFPKTGMRKILLLCGEDKLGRTEWEGKGRRRATQEIILKCLFPQNTAEENFQRRDPRVILPLGLWAKKDSSMPWTIANAKNYECSGRERAEFRPQIPVDVWSLQEIPCLPHAHVR